MNLTTAELSDYLVKSSERWDRLCQAVAATVWADGYIAGMNDEAEGRNPDIQRMLGLGEKSQQAG